MLDLLTVILCLFTNQPQLQIIAYNVMKTKNLLEVTTKVRTTTTWTKLKGPQFTQ